MYDGHHCIVPNTVYTQSVQIHLAVLQNGQISKDSGTFFGSGLSTFYTLRHPFGIPRVVIIGGYGLCLFAFLLLYK
jgi:hypothetical protein